MVADLSIQQLISKTSNQEHWQSKPSMQFIVRMMAVQTDDKMTSLCRICFTLIQAEMALEGRLNMHTQTYG
jgi:hypothetical protein